MDISIIIQIFVAVINLLFVTLTLVSVILIYKTIKTNQDLNKKIIFNEVVKQERELRIKLSEYREEIHKRLKRSKKQENYIEITLDYDTLLFNYYEYLAICIHRGIINEKETKRYFLDLVKEVKEKFEYSLLFEKNYAQREQYPGIQWLFKKWDI